MPPIALVVQSLSSHAPAEPKTFTEPFRVGRTPDCQVQVNHPLVSRHHLIVRPEPAGWYVLCEGRNGMLVDGMPVREALITHGTRIQLGDASGPAIAMTPVGGPVAPPGAPGAPQAAMPMGSPPGQPMMPPMGAPAGPPAGGPGQPFAQPPASPPPGQYQPAAGRPLWQQGPPGAAGAPAPTGPAGAPGQPAPDADGAAGATQAPGPRRPPAVQEPSPRDSGQTMARPDPRPAPPKSHPDRPEEGARDAGASGSPLAPGASAPSADAPSRATAVGSPDTRSAETLLGAPPAPRAGAPAGPMPPAASPGEDVDRMRAPVRRQTIQAFRITAAGTIGRAPDNALVLDDPLVSKHHARIEPTPQGILITDLGSTNGIYLGPQRVPRVLVTRPSIVGIGATFIAVNPDGTCEVQVNAGTGGELIGQDLVFEVNGGDLRLLDGVSFSLPGNELLAVVGPSGAGKSTLLKALTGEQKAQHGQVLFDGIDVYDHYPIMRNKIGVVPQNDVIHQALTVQQTMDYAAELRFAKDVSKEERRRRIAEVLEDLDLTQHVDKRVKKLSGGQRKRVSTAIELLTRPSLLFLDEPTSGLDPQLDRDVMDLLASLAHGTRPGDTGRTVVVVTHNENHIDRADKVLILAAGGKPVYYGPPQQILTHFRQRHAELTSQGRLKLYAPKGDFTDPPAIDGFADVYALIRNHTPELRQYLEATVPSTRRGGAPAKEREVDASTRRIPKQSALRQMSTLVRRHLRIIAADPSYLVFMLALPVVMGLLTKAIPGSDGFSTPVIPEPTAEQPCVYYSNQVLQLLVILVTGAAFSGMSVTIRELIGERDVFLREKAVGLRSGSYLLAKTIVLALIVTIQVSLMVGISLALNKAPSEAILLGNPGLELAMGLWAVAFASGLLGLAVSAFVSSSEQVMPVLVVSIMAQLVLSGGIIPVTGKAVFEQLSWVMPSRWGFAMTAGTVDLNTINPLRSDELWDHASGQWLANLGVLGAILVVALTVCYVGLWRRGRR
ncbi:ATP-binding cassette domain-containing protein [Actinomyces sp. zg296]|uniref:ATP-binding cassette domain-containing protein n=1 Tax=Actinomyces sp. zg296 TaxID=2609289 RepID=UPI00135A381F|nr:ATP-binding cassette domain-containing protein [Actinomyces sp. zg296]